MGRQRKLILQKLFQKMVKRHDREMYSTYNGGKCVVVERFSKTLKKKFITI